LKPLKAEDAVALLQQCVDISFVVPSKHFREELSNEGLDLVSAYHVLKKGLINAPPEQDIKTGDWKYRVEGREPDGKWLAIVFCFKEWKGQTAFLITCFTIARLDR
jgi:hypothetical protein